MKKLMKKMLEKFFYKFYSKKYEDLNLLIDSYDYVSFDIFDTLIKRNVKNPTDIFDIVEKEYNKTNSLINNFKENRIKAEKKAIAKSLHEEITLEEIYSCMEKYTKTQKEKLMKLEIETEINFCVQNKQIYSIYENCIKKQKKIFFTSDMYLSKKVIETILNNAGYTKCEKLYLSSSENLKKISGNLFKKILEENNIDRNKIIHIGDSLLGDYLVPNKIKIKSILLKRTINNRRFSSNKNNSLEYNVLSSFINNQVTETENKSQYRKLGYEVLGPMIYGFTSWIHQKVKEDKIDKLYFLARDAKIIMDIYKKRFNDEVPIYYLEVSRKAIISANLGEIHSFDNILDKYKSIIKGTSKVIDFIRVLNLDYKKYNNLNKNLLTKLIMDLNKEEKQAIFLNIKKDLEQNYKYQNQCLKEYLEQNDMRGNVALIDIGWNGTIQYFINNFVDSKTQINGYYFGVNQDKKYKEYKKIIRKGFLFDNNNSNENQYVIGLGIGIFEMMFLSTEGSTISYKEIDNKIKAIHDEKEYSTENLIDIQSIQNGANDFVENIGKSKIEKYLDYGNNDFYFEDFKHLIIKPSKRNINIFKNIHFQNFDNKKLIETKSLIYYIFHVKSFYKDFMNSYCKVYFMKCVFGMNLPYYYILKKLYKINKF